MSELCQNSMFLMLFKLASSVKQIPRSLKTVRTESKEWRDWSRVGLVSRHLVGVVRMPDEQALGERTPFWERSGTYLTINVAGTILLYPRLSMIQELCLATKCNDGHSAEVIPDEESGKESDFAAQVS
jgi:hypothetical protein